nr:AAA family ATPase [Bradyrhizobium sp. Bra64]
MARRTCHREDEKGTLVVNLADIHPRLAAEVEAAKAEIDAHAKAANDNQRKTLQLPEAVKGDQKERFQVTWFDDVDQSTAKEEILQGVLGAGEFSLFVAKPGTGKSVLVGDIGCHVAAGKAWHGRKVKQGLVVFFAAERKKLTERRVAAWRKTHGVSGIPFVVVGGKLDLTSGAIDARALAATIKGLEEKSRHKCILIVLDTVTRTFGPGDQNQSKDMQRYVASVDELTRATEAHVAAIHHSGWEGDRGKGAIDLDGAIDVSFGVTVTGSGPSKVFTLACTGSNDGEEGAVTSFRLDSVELGTDTDGNVTTAPVVVQAGALPCKTDGSNLKGNAAKALESLRVAIGADGESPPAGSPGFPEGVLAVTRDAWRNRFLADAWGKEPKAAEDTLSKRFRRAVIELTEGNNVSSLGQWFWLDSRTLADMSGH